MSPTQPSYEHQGADGAPGLRCASHAEGSGFTRVKLSGELDLATAPKLRDELAEAAHDSTVVILDLSELTFMDSTGLHVIVSARARLADEGCHLVIVRGSRQVHQLFELTGVNRLLDFVCAPDARGLLA